MQMEERRITKSESFLSAWRQELLIAAFLMSVAVVVIFGVRAFHRAPHRKVDERIRPWMSLPYVAHSYRVPPHVLYEALDLPPKPRDRRSIKQIARAQNLPVQEVILALQQAIERARPLPPALPSNSPPTPTQPPAPR